LWVLTILIIKWAISQLQKLADGNSLLLFKHLDLRAANGADLKIVISNIAINKAANIFLKQTILQTKPEVLTNGGIGAEIATLTVTSAIADLERSS